MLNRLRTYTNLIETYPNFSNCNQFLDLNQPWLCPMLHQTPGAFHINQCESPAMMSLHDMMTKLMPSPTPCQREPRMIIAVLMEPVVYFSRLERTMHLLCH